MDRQYFVTKACLTRDRQEVLAVWDRNRVATFDPAGYYSWAYLNNPFGEGPIFLLVHAPTQHVVGSAGLILRSMKIGNSAHLVGRAAGFAIDKSHRSLGPALALFKAVLSEMDNLRISYVYTLAPPNAASVFKRLNFRSLGNMNCLRKIISTSDFVGKQFPAWPRFGRQSLSWVLDSCIQILETETWGRPGREKMIRVHDLDARFDDLWRRAASHYSFTTERSSVFLRWRFADNPQVTDHICYALSTDEGVLRGYAIYYLDEYRYAHVIDLFAEDPEQSTIALLAGLARRWRLDGVRSVVVSAFGTERFFGILGKVGLSRFRAPAPGPYELFVSTGSDSTVKAASVELNWGFTMADDFF